MSNDMALESSPLARIAEEKYHHAILGDKGVQELHDFAAKFSLDEWQQAAKFMGTGKGNARWCGDLAVTDEKDAIVIHCSQASINERINAVTHSAEKMRIAGVGGAVVVAATFVDNGGLGVFGRVVGAAAFGYGMVDYYLSRPATIKALHSMEHIVVLKKDLWS